MARTTIDLDPDVDAKLRAAARERGLPLREVINATLREGLRGGDPRSAPSYTLPTFALGVRSDIDLDRALRLAGDLEDEEIVRKLALRK